MTVSSAQNKVSYAGDGSTTVFSVPFLFQANADITAILRDGQGAETTWVEGTDYTLSGAGDPSGGTLTATTAPASGEKLTIKRVVSLTQETDYPEGGQFPAQSHEDALDRGTMADQQLQEQIDRTVKLKSTSALSNIDFPEPGADELVKWNAAGTALETKKVADISAITLPVAVSKGGTGATTAGVARTNLGVPPSTRAINSGAGLSGGGDLSADRTLAIATGGVTAAMLAADAEKLNALPQAIKTATPYPVVAGDVGTMLIANLGSAITFDLTAAATLGARFLAFIKNIGAGTLTIDPNGAETIDGNATLALAKDEWTMIWTDGSNWRSLGAMAVGAENFKFLADKSVSQSIPNATSTKIQFDNEVFDPAGDYDPTTNYRHTPSRAGKWLYGISISLLSPVDQQAINMWIAKNGANVATREFRASGTDTQGPYISALVDMNGSTDFVEGFIHQTAGVSKTLPATSDEVFFHGVWVAPA